MRTHNAVRNSIFGISYYFLTFIISFIAKTVFIKILGNEYNGLNGLFSNIISILSIAELGIGSAIIFNLYKPIAENNRELIKALMKIYKKAYQVIALIVFILGLLFLPFVNLIVGENNINENLGVIFLLYLLSTIVSYLFTYNRSIIIAHQENYIIIICDILYKIILNIFQILILGYTKNYILYLLIQVIFTLVENIIITIIAYKKYPYLKEKNVKSIPKEMKENIFLSIKGLLYYKISGSFINGTDNIIIANFCGIITVGSYSNYLMIITVCTTLLSQAFSATTSSVGNLLATSDDRNIINTYHNMLYLQFLINNVCYTLLYNIMHLIIKMWLGTNFLLSNDVLLLLIISNYIASMGLVIRCFKESAGIYHEDRFIPIIEALMNIGISIVLGKLIGINGIILGTIISSLIRYIYDYPVYVFKRLFKESMSLYFYKMLKYIIIFFISFILSSFLSNLSCINNKSLIFELIIKSSICITIPVILFVIFTFKCKEYNQLIYLIKNVVNFRKR